MINYLENHHLLDKIESKTESVEKDPKESHLLDNLKQSNSVFSQL